MDKDAWSKLSVLCDEVADRQLFLAIKNLSDCLSAIPDKNIQVYPRSLTDSSYKRVQPLMVNDRPDFIVMVDKIPLLMIELTEHGYTGDNPLQRFTRLAAAAENSVPVIYFGPFARVRDDELDIVDDPSKLSKRRVNTDLFLGMSKLSSLFSVPMTAVEWITGDTGKPLKISRGSDKHSFEKVFGKLVNRIELFTKYSLLRHKNQSIDEKLSKKLSDIAKELSQAHANPNVRGSQTKLLLNSSHIRAFFENPCNILNVITPTQYFMHDKPERLLALLCILHTSIQYLESRSGMVPINEIPNLFDYLVELKPGLSKGCCFYYTGYKWRSDPHCGVLVNLDYLKARKPNEKTAEDRSAPLILYYPRIYLYPKSPNVMELGQKIKEAAVSGSEFNQMFIQRYGAKNSNERAVNFLRNTSGHIARWTDTTKQSRIFRRYCDFIVLQDAILIGNHLR